MPAAGVVPASGAYDQITWDFITLGEDGGAAAKAAAGLRLPLVG